MNLDCEYVITRRDSA